MTGSERLKWLLIDRWPAGYRLASRVYQGVWDRRASRDNARRAAFYRRLIPPGGLCFDVGANHGDRTGAFLALGARVVAVEPQPHCARRLRARFGRDPSFRLVEKALGPRPGEATLYLGKNDLISTLSREWLEGAREIPELRSLGWEGTLTVAVTTLEELIAEHGEPDFCKIDVEGSELEVLEGLRSPLRALSFEYTRWRLQPALAAVELLCRLGSYRFNFSAMESLEMRFPGRWLDAGEVKAALEAEAADRFGYGDVYARLEPPSTGPDVQPVAGTPEPKKRWNGR